MSNMFFFLSRGKILLNPRNLPKTDPIFLTRHSTLIVLPDMVCYVLPNILRKTWINTIVLNISISQCHSACECLYPTLEFALCPFNQTYYPVSPSTSQTPRRETRRKRDAEQPTASQGDLRVSSKCLHIKWDDDLFSCIWMSWHVNVELTLQFEAHSGFSYSNNCFWFQMYINCRMRC